ncbi:MAG: SipW-dependent-type signal peptide-containing protein [Clostridia bacterium]|nr:SipW-dependent-type signal peptide-containing protein [Clostridia bacterium]
MNMKKIAILALSLCMVAAIAVTGTIAYFTDTDSDVNVFVAGNVKIVQNETDRNGADYVEAEGGNILRPIVDDSKDNGYHMGGNYVDKFVTVTNDGNEPAYVRTYIAFPAALDDGHPSYDANQNFLHWNGASAGDSFGAAQDLGSLENSWYWTKKQSALDWPKTAEDWQAFQIVKNENSMVYNVYVATHKAIVPAGATTAPSLMGVYLDSAVDFDNDNGYYTGLDKDTNETVRIDFDLRQAFDIPVISEAVQSAGFEDYADQENVAWYALDKAFGEVGTYCPFEGYTLK